MTQDNVNLLQRLSQLQGLTASESKLAVFFEEHYPAVAFANLAEISERNGLSHATVTRFVRRLGYTNFHSFLRALRDEVAQNFDSPLDRFASRPTQHDSPTPHILLQQQFEMGAINLQRTLEQTDKDSFSRIVDIVADTNRPLFLMSVASGNAILQYFYTLLRYVRGNVHMLDGDSSTLPHRVVDAGQNSVLFSLAIDRHPMDTLVMLRHFHSLNRETVLLTNRFSSPLLHYARHALFVHTERQSLFKSRCSVLVMLEAILAGVSSLHQADIDARYQMMDALSRELGVFLQK